MSKLEGFMCAMFGIVIGMFMGFAIINDQWKKQIVCERELWYHMGWFDGQKGNHIWESFQKNIQHFEKTGEFKINEKIYKIKDEKIVKVTK